MDEASGALNTTLARGTIGTIEGLDSVSANDMSMTMLYDEENGYYGLLIVNAATNIMYFVNLDVEEDVETYEAVKVAIFDGVTRISTLYDDFFDGNIIGIAEVSDKDANVRKFKNMSVEKLRVQEIAKLVPIEKEADGSVNSVKGMTFVNKPVDKKADVVIDLPPMSKMTTIGESTTGDDGSALVEISSDELFENGLFEITYDPDKLTFVEGSVNTDADYGSVENDATNGVVTIAALCLDGLKAGETIASVTFNVSCDNSSVTVATKEFNEDLALEESVSVTVQGTGHDWNAPSWSWATDYSSATATFVCKNNSEHQEVLNATVTPKVTDPTCTEDGKIVYQATVTGPDGETYTDEQTVTGDPKTGHDWNAPTWNWSDDNSSATATFVCKNDSTHTETIPATMSEEVTKEPTTEEEGLKTVTASVTGPDGEPYEDQKEVAIPKLKPVVPDTGDHSHLGAYAATTVISLLGMIIIIIRRKGALN